MCAVCQLDEASGTVEIESGCIFISGAVEFDDRPGPVRDALASSVKTWLAALYRAVVQAKEEGQLHEDADEAQMAFEIHGLILALHYEARFLESPGSVDRAHTGFANILARYGSQPAPASPNKVSTKASSQNPFKAKEKITMPTYTPPLRDMQFVMHEVLKVTDDFKAMPQHAEIDADTINAVLEEGGKFAAEVTFPLNISGDEEGCTLDKATHEVTPPKGFKEAYAKYVEGGWAALCCDPAYGGQGLPLVVNQCFYEMLNSANQAWTMYPGLTHGAYAALHAHGTDEQKQTYLPKMTSGEWTGTMCLTEAHCGTDLGLMRTKAEPQADGSYKLTGNKIFISAGEHDMAENIIHLVLARLPDAPLGIKGVSLFIVPKFLVNKDGTLGARNGIYCGGLEHKMGIHGNATAQIVLDGAIGTLVGQPNKGLNAMFVMMNAARLGVGNQSLGLTEVAYQNALAYAKDRIQMRSLTRSRPRTSRPTRSSCTPTCARCC